MRSAKIINLREAESWVLRAIWGRHHVCKHPRHAGLALKRLKQADLKGGSP